MSAIKHLFGIQVIVNASVINLVTLVNIYVIQIENVDKIICNNKQKWNKDKCRYECKELIDEGVCDKSYIWNPSNCECEWDKSCNISVSI